VVYLEASANTAASDEWIEWAVARWTSREQIWRATRVRYSRCTLHSGCTLRIRAVGVNADRVTVAGHLFMHELLAHLATLEAILKKKAAASQQQSLKVSAEMIGNSSPMEASLV